MTLVYKHGLEKTYYTKDLSLNGWRDFKESVDDLITDLTDQGYKNLIVSFAEEDTYVELSGYIEEEPEDTEVRELDTLIQKLSTPQVSLARAQKLQEEVIEHLERLKGLLK